MGPVGQHRCVEEPQLVGPDVDVRPLQVPHAFARLRGERGPVPVLHDDEVAVTEGELDVPLDQCLHRRARVGRGAHPVPAALQQLPADRHEHLGEHRVLGGEVLVQRRPGDAARCAELGDGDAVEALLREQRGGDVEDLLAPRGHETQVSGR